MAMMLGESVDVDAPVSTRLAHGLEHYQDILTTLVATFFSTCRYHATRTWLNAQMSFVQVVLVAVFLVVWTPSRPF